MTRSESSGLLALPSSFTHKGTHAGLNLVENGTGSFMSASSESCTGSGCLLTRDMYAVLVLLSSACSCSILLWMFFISSRRSWKAFFVASILLCKVCFVCDKSRSVETCCFNLLAASFSRGGCGLVILSTNSLTGAGNCARLSLSASFKSSSGLGGGGVMPISVSFCCKVESSLSQEESKRSPVSFWKAKGSGLLHVVPHCWQTQPSRTRSSHIQFRQVGLEHI